MAAERVGTEVALDFLTTESGQGGEQNASRRRLQAPAPVPESSPSSFRSRGGSVAPSVLDGLVRGPSRAGEGFQPRASREVHARDGEVWHRPRRSSPWACAAHASHTPVPLRVLWAGSRTRVAGWQLESLRLPQAGFSSRTQACVGQAPAERCRPAGARPDGRCRAARQEKLAAPPPPPAQILEEVPKARRVCLEYEHVSAWVPASAASSGLLPDLRWLCARRARTADRGCSDSDSDGAAETGKHRQARRRGARCPCCPLPRLPAGSLRAQCVRYGWAARSLAGATCAPWRGAAWGTF
jgi:hypothetical protein